LVVFISGHYAAITPFVTPFLSVSSRDQLKKIKTLEKRINTTSGGDIFNYTWFKSSISVN